MKTFTLLVTLGCLTGISLAQRSSCDRYRRCMDEVNREAKTCAETSRREFDKYRPQMPDVCTWRFFERSWWGHRILEDKGKFMATCIPIGKNLRAGCPGAGVPWGQPGPVLKRKKRQAPVELMSNDELKKRLESRINQFCRNGAELLRELRSRLGTRDFASKADVRQFIVGFCRGRLRLRSSEIPDIYSANTGATSLVKPIIAHPLMKAVASRLRAECKNHERLLSEMLRYLTEEGLARSETINLINSRCRGSINLEVDDLPADFECYKYHAKAKQCEQHAESCGSAAQFCEHCYLKSDLERSYQEHLLNMLRLDKDCGANN